ncbi:MAG: hypothetical protein ABIO70_33795 [Pseudomonadota bacterium]
MEQADPNNDDRCVFAVKSACEQQAACDHGSENDSSNAVVREQQK